MHGFFWRQYSKIQKVEMRADVITCGVQACELDVLYELLWDSNLLTFDARSPLTELAVQIRAMLAS
jgi:hypothetical protein